MKLWNKLKFIGFFFMVLTKYHSILKNLGTVNVTALTECFPAYIIKYFRNLHYLVYSHVRKYRKNLLKRSEAQVEKPAFLVQDTFYLQTTAKQKVRLYSLLYRGLFIKGSWSQTALLAAEEYNVKGSLRLFAEIFPMGYLRSLHLG